MVTPHERSEVIGAFDVYVTPELLKGKVPVICPFTACVRRHRETHYISRDTATPGFAQQVVDANSQLFAPREP